MSDDEFEPRLGRIRVRGGKRARKYLGRVVAAVARAGATSGVRSPRFDGSRIGRGASVGRVLHGGDRHAAVRARRVVVKTRLVRLGAKGLSGARAHLRYIQRDDVGADGTPGGLYSAVDDAADGKGFSSAAPATGTSSASSSRPRTATNIPTSSRSYAG